MYTDTQRAAGSALERCSLRACQWEDLANHVNTDSLLKTAVATGQRSRL